MLPEISLASLTLEDGDEVFRVWSDFETVKLTNWAHTPTPEACAERLQRVLARYAAEPRHFGPLVIRDGERRFIGLIGADLHHEASNQYEVWYILCREAWGRGFASRALDELLVLMRASGRVQTLMATVVTSNAASLRLLERRGFERSGLLPGGHQKHGLVLDLFEYERAM